MQEDTNIKYLNTPETPIFEKSKVLYNLNNINNSTNIYLVEGYIDAIALSKLGKPAVALMATNLSTHNELLITNKFTNIYIFLDNDEPGKQAAEKLKDQLSKYKNNIKVIHLDNKYKDIDEYVRNKEHILESMTR